MTNVVFTINIKNKNIKYNLYIKNRLAFKLKFICMKVCCIKIVNFDDFVYLGDSLY